MSDISLHCSGCGRDNLFSEYTLPEHMVCSECGNLLSTKRKSAAQELRMHRLQNGDKMSLQGTPVVETHAREGYEPVVVRKPALRLPSAPSALVGGAIFLLLGGAMVGAQYLGQTNAAIMDFYLVSRYVVLAVGCLLVIIEAFFNSQVQGFLVLLLPPYLLWYVLTSMESFWRQAVFFAVLLMLGMEMYFMRDQALVSYANTAANSAVEWVGSQIQRAGDAPLPSL